MKELEAGPEHQAPGKLLLLVVGVGCLPIFILLGILPTILVPGVVRNLFTSNEGRAKADIVALSSAIDQYAIEKNGEYPANLEVLVTPDENGFTYLGKIELPRDPWGHVYLYDPPPAGTNDYRVLTYGADGTPDGEGPDRDIDIRVIRTGEI